MEQNKLILAMSNLDANAVYEYVKELREQNVSLNEIQMTLNEGMVLVGNRYEAGEYFLADLIYSGLIYENVLKMEGMKSVSEKKKEAVGTVVIGTVEGDVHDIGKSILVSSLTASGFVVYDIGSDASPEKFIESVKANKPDIVCISGVMSFAVAEIKNTINALRYAGLRDGVKIIIGGNRMLEENVENFGADAYGATAMDGVNECLRLIGKG